MGVLKAILERLNIDSSHWLYMTTQFESRFKGLVGSAYKLKQACEKPGFQRTPGITACKSLFPSWTRHKHFNYLRLAGCH